MQVKRKYRPDRTKASFQRDAMPLGMVSLVPLPL
jgi:hypothetical protein